MPAAWLVGSATWASTITVDATAVAMTTNRSHYLRHATASLSMIDTVAADIVTAVGGTCTITIRENRRVRIVFNTARSVTWGTGTVLRDLLGFTGNLASASTHDAHGVSPLLWSPGFLATPSTIAGTTGYTMQHQAYYKSDDGTQVYVDHLGEETWQELEWQHILPERMRVATGTGGGTFHEFFEQCAKLGRRFGYYEEVDENDASTDAVTWPTVMGPYVLRAEAMRGNWYDRNVPNAEVSASLDLPMHLVDEYS